MFWVRERRGDGRQGVTQPQAWMVLLSGCPKKCAERFGEASPSTLIIISLALRPMHKHLAVWPGSQAGYNKLFGYEARRLWT